MRPVALACREQHAPELETMQGVACKELYPARLPHPVRAATGPEVEYPHTLPPGLLLFIREFLGERAVRREKSHKAAPDSFRRYDGSF